MSVLYFQLLIDPLTRSAKDRYFLINSTLQQHRVVINIEIEAISYFAVKLQKFTESTIYIMELQYA